MYMACLLLNAQEPGRVLLMFNFHDSRKPDTRHWDALNHQDSSVLRSIHHN
jgi:hypothetical protein